MKQVPISFQGSDLSIWVHDKVLTGKGYLPDLIALEIETTHTFFEVGLLEYWQYKFGKEGMGIFVDIGANIGNHSLFAKRFLSSRIVAIEPNPINFEILVKNIGVASFFAVGLSDKPGEMRLQENFAQMKDGGQFIANAGGTALEEGKGIKVVTLDSLNLPDADVIKIDVENMEEQVLKGGMETLERLRPIVYTEANTITSAITQIALMRDINYCCTFAYNFGNPGLEFTPIEKL